MKLSPVYDVIKRSALPLPLLAHYRARDLHRVARAITLAETKVFLPPHTELVVRSVFVFGDV